MAKVKRLTDQSGDHSGYVVNCPACGYWHLFDTRWTFNGDVERPTFTPSMLVNAGLQEKYPDAIRCHSFVTDGRIQFLGDCSHVLARTTVDLPDVDS